MTREREREQRLQGIYPGDKWWKAPARSNGIQSKMGTSPLLPLRPPSVSLVSGPLPLRQADWDGQLRVAPPHSSSVDVPHLTHLTSSLSELSLLLLLPPCLRVFCIARGFVPVEGLFAAFVYTRPTLFGTPPFLLYRIKEVGWTVSGSANTHCAVPFDLSCYPPRSEIYLSRMTGEREQRLHLDVV
jgi:hypothetical protein